MSKPIYPPTLLADYYKISHREQYPTGTEYVYSTWIPRGTKIEGLTEAVAFGFQAAIKELVATFQTDFFDRDVEEVLAEYARIIKFTLNVENPGTDHLRYLHGFGYLPLDIWAIPEGTAVPLRVPMVTIENTDPECFWLTNFIETVFSSMVWQPTTSATIAREYRKILNAGALETHPEALEGVAFQGHDFSYRGMVRTEGAAASGAGHLLSFVGTDTIPAILFAEHYYGADVEQELVGTSIPATEHSVMMASGRDEYACIKRLITEVYPTGFLSIVCDTWDLFKVVTEVLAQLKDEILARDGCVVVRPDSGDPVDIIAGTQKDEWADGHSDRKIKLNRSFGEGVAAEEKGVIECLWDIFGGTISSTGYKILDPHVGAIYGDSITIDRATRIRDRLKAKGFATTKPVLGIGSYTYQYQTRDSLEQALKSTWVQINGVEHNIMKDPVTDSGVKKSLTGRVSVRTAGGLLQVFDGLSKVESDRVDTELEPVFYNGALLRDEKFSVIRQRVLDSIT